MGRGKRSAGEASLECCPEGWKSSRWEFQGGAVKQVAKKVHLELMAVAVVVMAWPNRGMVMKLSEGHAGGMLERTGALEPRMRRGPMDLGKFRRTVQEHASQCRVCGSGRRV